MLWDFDAVLTDPFIATLFAEPERRVNMIPSSSAAGNGSGPSLNGRIPTDKNATPNGVRLNRAAEDRTTRFSRLSVTRDETSGPRFRNERPHARGPRARVFGGCGNGAQWSDRKLRMAVRASYEPEGQNQPRILRGRPGSIGDDMAPDKAGRTPGEDCRAGASRLRRSALCYRCSRRQLQRCFRSRLVCRCTLSGRRLAKRDVSARATTVNRSVALRLHARSCPSRTRGLHIGPRGL